MSDHPDPLTEKIVKLISRYEHTATVTGHSVAWDLREVLAAAPLVCSLCLFVGESEDPRPITILNGQLVCEPHNGYFQGGDHVQAIVCGSERTRIGAPHDPE